MTDNFCVNCKWMARGEDADMMLPQARACHHPKSKHSTKPDPVTGAQLHDIWYDCGTFRRLFNTGFVKPGEELSGEVADYCGPEGRFFESFKS